MTTRIYQLEGQGWVPEVEQTSLWQRAWTPFWMVPVACSVAAVILGIILPAIDGVALGKIPFFFHAGPDGARNLLTTIATVTIGVTGPVFSITLVVLQLASSQFTPRILGSFLESRVTQFALGIFIGTFLYSLTVVRSVRSEPEFVPQIATSFAFLLAVAAMGIFLAFIRHIMLSIQLCHVIFRTQLFGMEAMDSIMPESESGPEATERRVWQIPAGGISQDVVYHGRGGYIREISYQKIADYAEEHNAVIEMLVHVGDYVPCHSPVARFHSLKAIENLDSDICDLLTFGRERSYRLDSSFALRQLVDIAERALSPGVNDPTSAIQCINCIHSLCRIMVTRRVPSNYFTDDDGNVRLIYRPQTVEQNLHIAVMEISHWGATSMRIAPRLQDMLDDLRTASLPDYYETLDQLKVMVDKHAKREGQSA